ncbi:MAG: hypothetical protein IID30_15320, partial [Planctomycetes bacterium]|nr:hypothetical protein [Planctomycetota bacterium]
NNLGNAWSKLPTGDRARNIEKAIKCYQQALEVWTKEALPHYHEIAKNNLKAASDDLDKLEK